MTKICQVTNKSYLKGNKISHSNKKSKRKFNINIKKKYTFINNLKLKLSVYAIKYLDKVYNFLNYKNLIKSNLKWKKKIEF